MYFNVEHNNKIGCGSSIGQGYFQFSVEEGTFIKKKKKNFCNIKKWWKEGNRNIYNLILIYFIHSNTD